MADGIAMGQQQQERKKEEWIASRLWSRLWSSDRPGAGFWSEAEFSKYLKKRGVEVEEVEFVEPGINTSSYDRSRVCDIVVSDFLKYANYCGKKPYKGKNRAKCQVMLDYYHEKISSDCGIEFKVR